MEKKEVAVRFREQNMRFVPLKLRQLQDDSRITLHGQPEWVALSKGASITVAATGTNNGYGIIDLTTTTEDEDLNIARPFAHLDGGSDPSGSQFKGRKIIPIHPATVERSQILTFRYLTSMGKYQELISQALEHNAMQLIFQYIDNLDSKNTLAFEALKYLASLLRHKQFLLEFINNGGLEVSLLKKKRNFRFSAPKANTSSFSAIG